MRRVKITILIVAGCCAAILLLGSGCRKKYAAKATCGGVEFYESGLGQVNLPQLTLGACFLVSQETSPPPAARVGVLSFGDADKETVPPVDSLSVIYNSLFTVEFQGKVDEKDKAVLSNQVRKNTKLTILHLKRVSLNNVTRLLNVNADTKTIKDYLLRYPNVKAFVVHSVLYADKLSIGLADGKQVGTNVSVFLIGNISLTVTYDCSNSLQVWGSGVAAFVKILPIFYDQSRDELYLGAPERIHFSELDWTSLIILGRQ